MTAKSLVLHIGDPKTGSSSIQQVLRNALYETDGFTLDYPAQLNAFPLANALWDAKQAEQRAPRFAKLATWLAASQADVAVVSAEQFFRVNPAVLQQALDEFLPDYATNIRIVAYVRPHVNRLLSAYMQRTKAGLFQGDLNTFFEKTKRENLLTYAPRFQSWRDQFGLRFTLRPMIRDKLRGHDVVTDFLDLALNGHAFKLLGAVEANASLALEPLAGLREVQGVLMRNKVAAGTRHSVGDYVTRALIGHAAGRATKLQLPPALYATVQAYCAADAATLDAAFFDQPLMTQALEQAATDTAPARQSNLAKDHFSEETVLALRQKGRRLVTLFKKRPAAWTQAFEREIGQRAPAEDGKPPLPPIVAHNANVNVILSDIADLIASVGTPAVK